MSLDVHRPLYRLRCLNCPLQQERIEELKTAELARAKHHELAPGHRVRLSFDIYDVFIDETSGNQELERR